MVAARSEVVLAKRDVCDAEKKWPDSLGKVVREYTGLNIEVRRGRSKMWAARNKLVICLHH